jgi:hypothetical protein
MSQFIGTFRTWQLCPAYVRSCVANGHYWLTRAISDFEPQATERWSLQESSRDVLHDTHNHYRYVVGLRSPDRKPRELIHYVVNDVGRCRG